MCSSSRLIRMLKTDLTWYKSLSNRTPEQELGLQQTLEALQRYYAGERNTPC